MGAVCTISEVNSTIRVPCAPYGSHVHRMGAMCILWEPGGNIWEVNGAIW
jgi:hypothetical protein